MHGVEQCCRPSGRAEHQHQLGDDQDRRGATVAELRAAESCRSGARHSRYVRRRVRGGRRNDRDGARRHEQLGEPADHVRRRPPDDRRRRRRAQRKLRPARHLVRQRRQLRHERRGSTAAAASGRVLGRELHEDRGAGRDRHEAGARGPEDEACPPQRQADHDRHRRALRQRADRHPQERDLRS